MQDDTIDEVSRFSRPWILYERKFAEDRRARRLINKRNPCYFLSRKWNNNVDVGVRGIYGRFMDE